MSSILCISLENMREAPVPAASVLSLGTFDGVHFAHRELLNAAKKLRSRLSADTACGVFCFFAPPSDHLLGALPAHLCTLAQKLRLFRECGMEYAFVADFPSIQNLSPEEFINNILQKDCHCVGAVCGFNFRFGKKGAGTAEDLKKHLPFPVEIQSAVLMDETPVSSTRIRQLLYDGNAEKAAELLCRPYSFTAPVIHGKHLGHKLGAPTVNQNIPQKMLIPGYGVYISDCEIDGKHFRAVTNVGVRPTVETDAKVNCESYLLDFCGDLYEKEITVSFLKYIRPEKRFTSQEELQEQIQKDIQAAKKY